MDVFKTLTKGARFDKERHRAEIRVFEPSKPKEEVEVEEVQVDEEELSAEAINQKNGVQVVGTDVPRPITNFVQLNTRYGMRDELLSVVIERQYTHPTAVQTQAIPCLLAGRHVIACAPTGSGKTIAFVLPILHLVLQHPKNAGIKAVLLSPTRELSRQTAREIRRFCFTLPEAKRACVVEPLISRRQLLDSSGKAKRAADRKVKDVLLVDAFQKKWDGWSLAIISAPPQRVVLALQNGLKLDSVEHLVFDEADRLFQLPAFQSQLDEIIAACTHPSAQKAFFSATIQDDVEHLIRSITHDAITVRSGAGTKAVNPDVKQELVYCGTEQGKVATVISLFREAIMPPVLLFMDSRERTKEMQQELGGLSLTVSVLHAQMTDAQRDATIASFRRGEVTVLITTDLLGRGVDFKDVGTVINFDFPTSVTSYIHRVGRTGRAGRKGRAITLFTEDDLQSLPMIASVAKQGGATIPDWMLKMPKRRAIHCKRKRDVISSAKRIEVGEKKLLRMRKRAEKRAAWAQQEGGAAEEWQVVGGDE
eukprot:TRINITY_DN4459_c0_g1_i1.p1 TRINITY_DN4459_c0_g1~~TRINITY_DN4459_c0_g1_i1.p1  ORF type:complete len:536 (+),score=114.98 TRINITY_DN4459_c0_g1_i1:47-1654(+)